MKIRKGVFVVCYRIKDEEILYLVLKRKLHWRGWEFVKGGLEGGSIREGVLKEVKEETGQTLVKLKKYNFSGKYRYDREFKDRPGVMWQSFSLYSAELKQERVKVDKHEHSLYKWVCYDKALKLLTWPNQRNGLRIVDRRLRGC